MQPSTNTDHLSELVARAKDIIHGRIQPEPLPVSASVQRAFDIMADKFRDKPNPPTAAASRRLLEQLCLQELYSDQLIASCRTADGTLAVLANGESEVFQLLHELSPAEQGYLSLDTIESNPFTRLV